MSVARQRVLIFARVPRPWRVKTRLIDCLGEQGAAELYGRLLSRTLRVALEADLAPVECLVDGDPDAPWFDPWRATPGLSFAPQARGDLGERMHVAFEDAFKRADRVVLIGSDCPVLEPAHLARAFEILELGHRAVLGPAEDGGYVLIGLRAPEPTLFEGIQWGGADVYAQTVARLDALGRGWAALDPLWDVDRPQDVARLRALGGEWS